MFMSSKSFIYVAVAVLLGIAALTLYGSSGGFDVVGQRSIPAFEAMLGALKEDVALDEITGSWKLQPTDGSIQFAWKKDFGEGGPNDLTFEFESGPFIEAGLSPALLPEGMLQGEKVVIGTRLAVGGADYKTEATPLASFAEIVRLNRSSIKYHADMDHFGISLGNGNIFEWAKDQVKNDKDMVFVLDPKPFIEAGADPTAIEGWVFGKVKVMDSKGRTVEVDKLLKPYNLDEME